MLALGHTLHWETWLYHYDTNTSHLIAQQKQLANLAQI